MTKTKSTKRALLVSALALLLCVSMLIGSTYAWFTDSVTSAGNIIKSGTLDVTMEWADGKEAPASAAWADASEGAIFDYSKWEPGFVQVRHIKIANKGTLALKYQIKIVVNGKVEDLAEDLAEVIDVYFVDPAVQVADRTALNGIEPIGTLAEVLANMPGNASGDLNAGASNMVTLALKMQESAGNEYQDKSIGTDFSVQLVATQDTVESDSFDDQYDVDAEYPLVASGKKALNDALILPFGETSVQIVIPAEAYEGSYSKVVTYENLTEENGEYTYAVDFAAELNGEKVDPAFEYEVTLQLPKFIDIAEITHNGNVIADWNYDAFTGKVTFKTNSFSPFEVTYTEVAENPTTAERKITGGIFTVDPVTSFDPSLGEVGSEYICVPYVKNGVSYYAVSKRATTVILAADDNDDDAFLADKDPEYYGNAILQESSSGKLWSIISDLKNNDFSTVYILPGTYNEDTAINVYSSMNIMGLGDTEDIKIIKVKGSYSNRHLFNCNGAVTREEHIEVSLRNLTLDATAKNLNSAGKLYLTDNGAVQSIRLSKVKCYDLNIVKSSGFAFYVNGKYDTRGAYLYAQDCTMTTNSVVDTADTFRFYYDNLTYGKGEYKDSTSYIKNIAMAADDWDW